MTQEMEVKPTRTVIAVLNHGRNAIVAALIVVLITKIAEASATTRNAIYVEKNMSSSSHLWNGNTCWCASGVIIS